MKIAVITDTHFDIHYDDKDYYNYYNKVMIDFFRVLRTSNISTVIHLGDLLDKQKNINILGLSNLHSLFIDRLDSYNITMHVLVGNHDRYYKNTNSYNSLEHLFKKHNNIHVYSSIEEIVIHNKRFLMVPWINSSNIVDFNTKLPIIDKSTIICGHFELKGFKMTNSMINESGMDSNLLSKFDMVLSGHYHTKSSKDNIHYLGSIAEYRWDDCDDIKGFHILDTETLELSYVKTNYTFFEKIFHNNMKYEYDHYKEKNVKYYINKSDRGIESDAVINTISKYASSINVIEINDSSKESLNKVQFKGTLEVLYDYVQSLETTLDKTKLISLGNELYNEAMTRNDNI